MVLRRKLPTEDPQLMKKHGGDAPSAKAETAPARVPETKAPAAKTAPVQEDWATSAPQAMAAAPLTPPPSWEDNAPALPETPFTFDPEPMAPAPQAQGLGQGTQAWEAPAAAPLQEAPRGGGGFDIPDDLAPMATPEPAPIQPEAPVYDPTRTSLPDIDSLDLPPIGQPTPIDTSTLLHEEAPKPFNPTVEAPVVVQETGDLPWKNTSATRSEEMDDWAINDLLPPEPLVAPAAVPPQAPAATPVPPMAGQGFSFDAGLAPEPLGGGAAPLETAPFGAHPLGEGMALPHDALSNKAAAPDSSEKKAFLFGGTPPWKRSGFAGEPPILPDAATAAAQAGKPGLVGKAITILVVLAVFFIGFKLFQDRDKAAEMLSRWTGTLRSISADLPESADDVGTGNVSPSEVVHADGSREVVSPRGVPELDEFSEVDEALDASNSQIAAAKDKGSKATTTQIELLDSSAVDIEQPIVADKTGDIPEDLSLFASIQKAIMQAKEKQQKEDHGALGAVPENVAPSEEDAYRRNQAIASQLRDQLEEYRKALAEEENPLRKPKPSEYFNQQRPQSGGQKPLTPPVIDENDARFGANPYNLPVVPEPTTEDVPNVRTLADFEAVMYERQETRVRMPRGLRPQMQATDQLPLEILSLIPNRGIIAFHQGREGVLLIGESIDGWELIAVYDHYAEFSNGQKRQTVTIK